MADRSPLAQVRRRLTVDHSLKFGADIRYLQLDNQAAFNTKGSFTFNNLQDYVNNFANQFTQALQVSSFDARQTQLFFFAQDDFRVTPNLTLNLGLRYENSSVPLGFFGAEDQDSLNALVPGPVQRDNNNWAPRVGFAYTPTPQGGFLKSLFGGEGQSVVRGGYGIGYDVLFLMFMAVGVSVPTPGAVGAFHESVRLALTSLYAADNDRAVAYAVALHALSFIPVSLVTLVLVAREGLTLRRIEDITRAGVPPGTSRSS